MPNWITNIVDISGKQPDVDQLIAHVTSDHSTFDFQKIIPMPPELNCLFGTGEVLEAQYGGIWSANMQKYGHQSWYTWCCEKWGTKWKAKEESPWWFTEQIDDRVYYRILFETAWSPPTPIFEHLRQLFPQVGLCVKYLDETEWHHLEFKPVQLDKTLVDEP